MESKTNTNENFTKVYDKIRTVPVKVITPAEKIFFAWIIGWQENNKTVTASNKYIADELGYSVDGVRTMIKKCNEKFNFFTSIQNEITSDNNNKYSSSHTINIDEVKLDKFIDSLKDNTSTENKVVKKVSKVVEVKVEQTTPIKQEVLVEAVKTTKPTTSNKSKVIATKEKLMLIFDTYTDKIDLGVMVDIKTKIITTQDFNYTSDLVKYLDDKYQEQEEVKEIMLNYKY